MTLKAACLTFSWFVLDSICYTHGPKTGHFDIQIHTKSSVLKVMSINLAPDQYRITIEYLPKKHRFWRETSTATIHKTRQGAYTSNREAALIKTEFKLEILQQMPVENVWCLLRVCLLSIVVGPELNRQIGTVRGKCFPSKMYVLLQVAT